MGRMFATPFSNGYDSRNVKPRRHAPVSPCVYFFEAEGTSLVKIGTVLRIDLIQERFNDLQIGCPYQLRIAFIHHGGGRREEHRFHKALDHLRFRGEWYRRERELADLLDAAETDLLVAENIAKRLMGT